MPFKTAKKKYIFIVPLPKKEAGIACFLLAFYLTPVENALADIVEMQNEQQYNDEQGDLTILGIKKGTYTLVLTKGQFRVSTKFTIQIGEQLKLKVVLQ